MAKVTFVITDTEDSGVNFKMDAEPDIDMDGPLTNAQALAVRILERSSEIVAGLGGKKISESYGGD